VVRGKNEFMAIVKKLTAGCLFNEDEAYLSNMLYV
jgi:hypothetical protein